MPFVTATEAVDKWCAPATVSPVVTTSSTSGGDTTNEYGIINPQDGATLTGRVKCIADECMLWHWLNDEGGDDRQGYCGFSRVIGR